MSFDFYLYRAAPGLGSLLQWEEDHAQPLGTPAELRAKIDTVFPRLRWSGRDGSWSACNADPQEVIELNLRATRGDAVQFVVVYAGPPVLRRLMHALSLNYCCAPESGALRDPFAVGDDWSASPAH